MARVVGVTQMSDEKFSDIEDAHLAMELEQVIKEANTAAIGTATGGVTRGELQSAVHFVAALRARYLATVKHLAHPEKVAGKPEEREKLIADLKKDREAYEEARAAMMALKHALAQGYISVEG